MNKKKLLKIVAVCLILALVVTEAILFIGNWANSFPNYLMFQSTFTYGNNYYRLQMTSFITNLWFTNYHMGIQMHDICGYLRILTLEEEYEGHWNLEVFDNRTETTVNVTTTQVETWSHLYTFNIHKVWTFYKNQPYFTVEITKTYLFDSESHNNQILFFVKNNGWHSNNATWFAYETEIGTFGYKVLEANPFVTIQTPPKTEPSESQINFYGERDDTMRQHKQGEVETITLLVYANQYGTWQDISQ